MRKYRNQPVEIDGIRFDSKAEARRYGELKLLESAGAISRLEHHPVFLLEEGFRDDTGKRWGPIRYEADFEYRENGRHVVEDVKGGRATQTQVFKLKAKLFRKRHPEIELRIVG
jgi:hypothetical protein